MSGSLREDLLSGRAGVEARHGALLAGRRVQPGMLATGAAALAVYVAGLVLLGISPTRICGGLASWAPSSR